MRKIVLLTVRDYYPYKTEYLSTFEKVEGVNIYADCIKPINLLSEVDVKNEREKAEAKERDPELWIQRTIIGRLFKDEKAYWTMNFDKTIGLSFDVCKDEGIPLLRKELDQIIFYVLPCTGTYYLQKGDEDAKKKRQLYTSNCIDAICVKEGINRTNLLAIIHSLDTGSAKEGQAPALVTKTDIVAGQSSNPLIDIISAGHLIMFHHVSGFDLVDKLLRPLCQNGDIDINLLDDYFEKPAIIDWWKELNKINKDYLY